MELRLEADLITKVMGVLGLAFVALHKARYFPCTQETEALTRYSWVHFLAGCFAGWIGMSYTTFLAWHVAWEVWENSEPGIECSELFNSRFLAHDDRQVYSGDSIRNSYTDIGCASMGWLLLHAVRRLDRRRHTTCFVPKFMQRGWFVDNSRRHRRRGTRGDALARRLVRLDLAHVQRIAANVTVIGATFFGMTLGSRAFVKFECKRRQLNGSWVDKDGGFQVHRA